MTNDNDNDLPMQEIPTIYLEDRIIPKQFAACKRNSSILRVQNWWREGGDVAYRIARRAHDAAGAVKGCQECLSLVPYSRGAEGGGEGDSRVQGEDGPHGQQS